MDPKCPLVVFTGGQQLITILIQIAPVNKPGPSHPLWYEQEEYK